MPRMSLHAYKGELDDCTIHPELHFMSFSPLGSTFFQAVPRPAWTRPAARLDHGIK